MNLEYFGPNQRHSDLEGTLIEAKGRPAHRWTQDIYGIFGMRGSEAGELERS